MNVKNETAAPFKVDSSDASSISPRPFHLSARLSESWLPAPAALPEGSHFLLDATVPRTKSAGE